MSEKASLNEKAELSEKAGQTDKANMSSRNTQAAWLCWECQAGRTPEEIASLQARVELEIEKDLPGKEQA